MPNASSSWPQMPPRFEGEQNGQCTRPCGCRGRKARSGTPCWELSPTSTSFPESCLQDDWTDDYAKSEAFAAEYRAVTDPDDGQKWQRG